MYTRRTAHFHAQIISIAAAFGAVWFLFDCDVVIEQSKKSCASQYGKKEPYKVSTTAKKLISVNLERQETMMHDDARTRS